MLPRNPAHDLLQAIKVADRQAYAAQHVARCYQLPEYECRQQGYQAFRQALHRYQPARRLRAFAWGLAIGGVLVTAAYKYYWLFTH